MRWGCWMAMGCGVLGSPGEGPDECADGIDNDRDMRWDADDPDCIGIALPEPEDATSDTDTPTSSTSDSCGDVDIEVSVGCIPNETFANITVSVGGGFPTGGELFMMDTANFPAWSESHPLDPDEETDCGSTFRSHLATGADVSDWIPGTSTLFWCADFFESRDDVMTYVVQLDGAGDRCVSWGHDPDGLLSGDYDYAMYNPPEFSFDGCEVLE